MNKHNLAIGESFIETRDGEVMLLMTYYGVPTFVDDLSHRTPSKDYNDDLTYKGTSSLDIVKVGRLSITLPPEELFTNIDWYWYRKKVELTDEETMILNIFEKDFEIIGRDISGSIYFNSVIEDLSVVSFDDHFPFINKEEEFFIKDLLEGKHE